MTQPERLEDQILQQVLVIQALRLRIARMESIYTTPRAIKSTGMNGITEDAPHKRDTIVDLGPADVRCVIDRDVDNAEDDGA